MSYEELLKEIGEVSRKRLMYGEWLADECEECHTQEHVRKYADVSGKSKAPIYLCDRCAHPGLKHLREWVEE